MVPSSEHGLGDVVFKVMPVGVKKPLATFTISMSNLPLRHAWFSGQKNFSFADESEGCVMSFKAHLESTSMMWRQLTALEDDEKLMAVQDLINMIKNGSGRIHAYLMDEQVLLALLDLTRHWIHDAMFFIDLATLIPKLWRAIIASPQHACVQYFALDNTTVCDFFEYFVDSLLGMPAKSKTNSSSISSPSNAPLRSPIFFNRERKLQLIQICELFLAKDVSLSFRASFISQTARLVQVVASYVISSSELKSSTPKSAQEEFLAVLLSPETYVVSNFGRTPPHALLIPVFASLLNNHNTLPCYLLIRILSALKELPAPKSLEIVLNANLVSALDALTTHDDKTIEKLAKYNWSKYMLVLTSQAT